MDTCQTLSNLLNASGEYNCSEASGSSLGQECHEATNSNKHNLWEVPGGPIAGAGNSHSSQTQADTLEISDATQLPVTKKPRKMVYKSSKSSDGIQTINNLPDELLLAILSYMSFRELLNVIPRVCSRWETLSTDAALWRHRMYVVRHGSTDEDIVRTLQMLSQLHTLVTYRPVNPSVFLALSANCHELVTLDLYPEQQLSSSEVKNLFNKCTKIHTLNITVNQLVSGILVESTLKLSNLCTLQLKTGFCKTSEAWLSALADRCPQLCDLDLKYTDYQIQDMEYFLNAKRNTLKRICVKWTSTSGRHVAPLLVGCASTLEHLMLLHCHTEHGGAMEAYAALGKLHNLLVLKFVFVLDDSNDALPLVFKNGGLSRLKELQFNTCVCVMDNTIIAVSRGCPALRELTLQNCELLTDAAFMDIHHLEQLEMLSFHECTEVGGAAIPCIARLPALHTLRFHSMDFRKLHSEHILDMSGLQYLYIISCRTQSVPFDRFPGRLMNLRELHLENCGNQHILNELRKQMPELKVHHEPYPDLLHPDGNSSDDGSDYANDYVDDYFDDYVDDYANDYVDDYANDYADDY